MSFERLYRHALLLTAATALCSAVATDARAETQSMPIALPGAFGTNLLETLSTPEHNTLLSPMSLRAAIDLTRAALGAEQSAGNETGTKPSGGPAPEAGGMAAEVPEPPSGAEQKNGTESSDDVASGPEPDGGGDPAAASPPGGKSLTTANAVWLDIGIEATPEALSGLDRQFGIVPRTLDLGTDGKQAINTWAAEATEGRIPELLETVPQEVSLMVTSAILFKDLWVTPFDETATADGQFTLHDGTGVSVPMMQSDEGFPVWQGEAGLRTVLPFRDGLSMMLHLPPEQTADATAEPPGWPDAPLDKSTAQMRPLVLPLLDLSADNDLSSDLAALGLEEEILAGLATLTTVPQRLGPVIQAVRLKVTEAGAEAAAVTAIAAARSMALLPAEPVRFDRPFDLYIYDPASGAVVVAAHVADPRG